MAELVKRQHYVPRTYLKHFCEDDEQTTIFVLPKESTNVKDIFSSSIQNVALKKHLYTMPGKTIKQKMAIEKFYSKALEANYDSIYQVLTNSSKNELSDSERELIISTVITMYYRTTIWFNMQDDLMNRSFEVAFQMAKSVGKDYFIYEGKKHSFKGKTLEEFSKEYNEQQRPTMVLTQLDVAMKLIKLHLKSDAIIVSKLSNEDDEFITSDNPVMVSNENGDRHPKPFDPNNILKLPLDKKHVLYLMPYAEKENFNTIFRNQLEGEVSSLERLACNYKQVVFAERFAFGTKEALEAYLKIKQNSEKELSDEEYSDLDSLTKVVEKAKKDGII